MDYVQGSIGRVFVARLADGESIYDAIEGLARTENVRAGICTVVGGIRRGRVVTGPETLSMPVEPHYEIFDDAREIIGVGTLFWDEEGPKLHLHAGIGRGQSALVGCPRGGATTYLVLEVVLLEIVGMEAERRLDPESGLKLLALMGGPSIREGGAR